MTPEFLAKRHPFLFHLTSLDAVDAIRRDGLLPPLALLDRFEADPATRAAVLARRSTRIELVHPRHGRAVITDNRPLSDLWLSRVLLDGLSPDDWRRMLAERVFLWASPRDLADLAGAELNRDKARVVLVFDTLSLARAHGGNLEITPINSGSTRRSVPPRGLATFAPLLTTDWDEWRWRRRHLKTGPDRIREVTVHGRVPDAARHLRAEAAPDRLEDVMRGLQPTAP